MMYLLGLTVAVAASVFFIRKRLLARKVELAAVDGGAHLLAKQEKRTFRSM